MPRAAARMYTGRLELAALLQCLASAARHSRWWQSALHGSRLDADSRAHVVELKLIDCVQAHQAWRRW
jgi:hypothetical protein